MFSRLNRHNLAYALVQKRSSEGAPISMTNVNISKSIPQYVSGTEGEVGRILGKCT